MRIYKLNGERVTITDFFTSLRRDCTHEVQSVYGDIASEELNAAREETFETKKELVKRGKVVRFENTSGNEYRSQRFYYTPTN